MKNPLTPPGSASGGADRRVIAQPPRGGVGASGLRISTSSSTQAPAPHAPIPTPSPSPQPREWSAHPHATSEEVTNNDGCIGRDGDEEDAGGGVFGSVYSSPTSPTNNAVANSRRSSLRFFIGGGGGALPSTTATAAGTNPATASTTASPSSARVVTSTPQQQPQQQQQHSLRGGAGVVVAPPSSSASTPPFGLTGATQQKTTSVVGGTVGLTGGSGVLTVAPLGDVMRLLEHTQPPAVQLRQLAQTVLRQTNRWRRRRGGGGTASLLRPHEGDHALLNVEGDGGNVESEEDADGAALLAAAGGMLPFHVTPTKPFRAFVAAAFGSLPSLVHGYLEARRQYNRHPNPNAMDRLAIRGAVVTYLAGEVLNVCNEHLWRMLDPQTRSFRNLVVTWSAEWTLECDNPMSEDPITGILQTSEAIRGAFAESGGTARFTSSAAFRRALAAEGSLPAAASPAPLASALSSSSQQGNDGLLSPTTPPSASPSLSILHSTRAPSANGAAADMHIGSGRHPASGLWVSGDTPLPPPHHAAPTTSSHHAKAPVATPTAVVISDATSASTTPPRGILPIAAAVSGLIGTLLCAAMAILPAIGISIGTTICIALAAAGLAVASASIGWLLWTVRRGPAAGAAMECGGGNDYAGSASHRAGRTSKSAQAEAAAVLESTTALYPPEVIAPSIGRLWTAFVAIVGAAERLEQQQQQHQSAYHHQGGGASLGAIGGGGSHGIAAPPDSMGVRIIEGSAVLGSAPLGGGPPPSPTTSAALTRGALAQLTSNPAPAPSTMHAHLGHASAATTEVPISPSVINDHLCLIGVDAGFTITLWNTTAERITGYSSREVVGHSVLSLVDDRTADAIGRVLNHPNTTATRSVDVPAVRLLGKGQQAVTIRASVTSTVVRWTRSSVVICGTANDDFSKTNQAYVIRQLNLQLQLEILQLYHEVNAATSVLSQVRARQPASFPSFQTGARGSICQLSQIVDMPELMATISANYGGGPPPFLYGGAGGSGGYQYPSDAAGGGRGGGILNLGGGGGGGSLMGAGSSYSGLSQYRKLSVSSVTSPVTGIVSQNPANNSTAPTPSGQAGAASGQRGFGANGSATSMQRDSPPRRGRGGGTPPNATTSLPTAPSFANSQTSSVHHHPQHPHHPSSAAVSPHHAAAASNAQANTFAMALLTSAHMTLEAVQSRILSCGQLAQLAMWSNASRISAHMSDWEATTIDGLLAGIVRQHFNRLDLSVSRRGMPDLFSISTTNVNTALAGIFKTTSPSSKIRCDVSFNAVSSECDGFLEFVLCIPTSGSGPPFSSSSNTTGSSNPGSGFSRDPHQQSGSQSVRGGGGGTTTQSSSTPSHHTQDIPFAASHHHTQVSPVGAASTLREDLAAIFGVVHGTVPAMTATTAVANAHNSPNGQGSFNLSINTLPVVPSAPTPGASASYTAFSMNVSFTGGAAAGPGASTVSNSWHPNQRGPHAASSSITGYNMFSATEESAASPNVTTHTVTPGAPALSRLERRSVVDPLKGYVNDVHKAVLEAGGMIGTVELNTVHGGSGIGFTPLGLPRGSMSWTIAPVGGIAGRGVVSAGDVLDSPEGSPSETSSAVAMQRAFPSAVSLGSLDPHVPQHPTVATLGSPGAAVPPYPTIGSTTGHATGGPLNYSQSQHGGGGGSHAGPKYALLLRFPLRLVRGGTASVGLQRRESVMSAVSSLPGGSVISSASTAAALEYSSFVVYEPNPLFRHALCDLMWGLGQAVMIVNDLRGLLKTLRSTTVRVDAVILSVDDGDGEAMARMVLGQRSSSGATAGMNDDDDDEGDDGASGTSGGGSGGYRRPPSAGGSSTSSAGLGRTLLTNCLVALSSTQRSAAQALLTQLRKTSTSTSAGGADAQRPYHNPNESPVATPRAGADGKLLDPLQAAVVLTKPFKRSTLQAFIRRTATRKSELQLLSQQAVRLRKLFQLHRNTPWIRGEVLGKGAYGVVFAAINTITGGRMAVKEIPFSAKRNKAKEGELFNEISVMCELTHPHIVSYLYCERTESSMLLFMELCDGGHLGDIIRLRKRLPIAEACRMTKQLISALSYLHSKNIVHRDLKPENVLMTATGEIKLTDFGAATRVVGELTETAGTVRYMAPEVFNGDPYGTACDVWSIGIIFLDLLGLPVGWLDRKDFFAVNAFYSDITFDTILPLPDQLAGEARNFVASCLAIDQKARPTMSTLEHHPLFFEDAPDVYLVRPPADPDHSGGGSDCGRNSPAGGLLFQAVSEAAPNDAMTGSCMSESLIPVSRPGPAGGGPSPMPVIPYSLADHGFGGLASESTESQLIDMCGGSRSPTAHAVGGRPASASAQGISAKPRHTLVPANGRNEGPLAGYAGHDDDADGPASMESDGSSSQLLPVMGGPATHTQPFHQGAARFSNDAPTSLLASFAHQVVVQQQEPNAGAGRTSPALVAATNMLSLQSKENSPAVSRTSSSVQQHRRRTSVGGGGGGGGVSGSGGARVSVVVDENFPLASSGRPGHHSSRRSSRAEDPCASVDSHGYPLVLNATVPMQALSNINSPEQGSAAVPAVGRSSLTTDNLGVTRPSHVERRSSRSSSPSGPAQVAERGFGGSGGGGGTGSSASASHSGPHSRHGSGRNFGSSSPGGGSGASGSGGDSSARSRRASGGVAAVVTVPPSALLHNPTVSQHAAPATTTTGSPRRSSLTQGGYAVEAPMGNDALNASILSSGPAMSHTTAIGRTLSTPSHPFAASPGSMYFDDSQRSGPGGAFPALSSSVLQGIHPPLQASLSRSPRHAAQLAGAGGGNGSVFPRMTADDNPPPEGTRRI